MNKANCIIKFLTEQISNGLKGLFWNGIINFIDQSYLILLMMSLINVNDLRLGTNYSTIENFTSTLALLWILLAATFPFVIILFYNRKIERSEPLPDLNDLMTLKQLK